METTALLVKQDELKKYLDTVLASEEEVVADLERILPLVKNEAMQKSFLKRIAKGNECLVALRAGFVPVADGWFTRTDSKSKWDKKALKETLDSMPPEVREIWDKVAAKGIFNSFSVTIRGGGDPLLVGNKGRKHFFIAGWLPIAPGLGIGLKIKL